MSAQPSRPGGYLTTTHAANLTDNDPMADIALSRIIQIAINVQDIKR